MKVVRQRTLEPTDRLPVDMPPRSPGASRVLIEPSRGWSFVALGELWEYRELLYFFIWRDVKVRYKQTLIGAGWAILQPVIAMILFSVVFGRFAKMPSDGFPYPIFAFAALLPWNFFATGLTRIITGVVTSAPLVSKVYFPRLIVPLAASVSGGVDFALAFVTFLGMMVWFKVTPTWGVLTLPLFLLLAVVTALGAGLWLAVWNVKYRDVGHMVPFLVQLWMFASPLVYSVSIVPAKWRLVYSLNPMAGVIEGFRWALLGKQSPDFRVVLGSALVVAALLVGGVIYFRKMERTFADVI